MRHDESTPAAGEYEPLFTIQVWQLLLIVGGLLVLAAYFLVGLTVPALDLRALALLALAGLLVLLVALRRRAGAKPAR